jgi:cell division protein FtsB
VQANRVGPVSRRPAPRRSARRPRRRSLALRWLAVIGLAAIAAAYVHPVRAYLSARDTVAERKAEIASLERQQDTLDHKIDSTRSSVFVEREARKLGLVRPGERLFIVTGTGK